MGWGCRKKSVTPAKKRGNGGGEPKTAKQKGKERGGNQALGGCVGTKKKKNRGGNPKHENRTPGW